MKVGDRVLLHTWKYEGHVDGSVEVTGVDGYATLAKRLADQHWWEVHFDDTPDETYERIVYPSDLLGPGDEQKDSQERISRLEHENRRLSACKEAQKEIICERESTILNLEGMHFRLAEKYDDREAIIREQNKALDEIHQLAERPA